MYIVNSYRKKLTGKLIYLLNLSRKTNLELELTDKNNKNGEYLGTIIVEITLSRKNSPSKDDNTKKVYIKFNFYLI